MARPERASRRKPWVGSHKRHRASSGVRGPLLWLVLKMQRPGADNKVRTNSVSRNPFVSRLWQNHKLKSPLESGYW